MPDSVSGWIFVILSNRLIMQSDDNCKYHLMLPEDEEASGSEFKKSRWKSGLMSHTVHVFDFGNMYT